MQTEAKTLPSLSLAFDDIVTYLTYELGISVVQLKGKSGPSLAEYMFSFSKYLQKNHLVTAIKN